MDSIGVTANALPAVTVSLPLDTACINLGPVTLSGESPAGGTWSGPGVTGNQYNPGATGSGTFGMMYTYMYSATGCSATATDSIVADICNGVENVVNTSIEIYPNPNNGEFVIIPSGAGVVDIYIYDSAGQLVNAQQANCSQSNAIRIDSSGLYTITVVNADGLRSSYRLIVNR